MKFFLTLNLKSIKKETLILYKTFLINILKKQNIDFSIAYLPKKRKKITLLKSPHVYKKAREQFEIIKYSIVIKIYDNINSKLFNILITNKPTTIVMKIKKDKGE